MPADRAAAVAAAEAAISDAEWAWLADWLCRLRRDQWERQRPNNAQDAEGRARPQTDARPSDAQEQAGDRDTTPRPILRHTRRD